MTKYFIIAILLCIISNAAECQITPARDSKLNYLMVPFSFPAVAHTNQYKLEIARGTLNDEPAFHANIVASVTTRNTKIIASVPEFGAAYTWRITDASNNKTVYGYQHFSTLPCKSNDSTLFHFNVTKKAKKYADAFVFSDANKALYDMTGKLVWFLPNITGIVNDYSVVRDIKITPQNTITFITGNMAYEVNYDAQILWQSPRGGFVSGDSEEHYHHEISRTATGNYMLLGDETLVWQWQRTDAGDSVAVPITNGDGIAAKTRGGLSLMGTIMECDKSGKIIWSWKSSSVYKSSQLEHVQTAIGIKEPHENAFYFDEKRKMIYISFKNTNQIIKLQYPEGKVVDIYDGVKLTTGTVNKLALFSEQHACKITANGDLMLYNNNMANSYAAPEVLVLQQPAQPNGKLKKVWEYVYPRINNKLKRPPLTSGGNVLELPGGEIFVSECVPNSEMYIVAKNKQLLWEANIEKWDVIQKVWKPFPQYRASIIPNRKRLEGLIWSGR